MAHCLLCESGRVPWEITVRESECVNFQGDDVICVTRGGAGRSEHLVVMQRPLPGLMVALALRLRLMLATVLPLYFGLGMSAWRGEVWGS